MQNKHISFINSIKNKGIYVYMRIEYTIMYKS